jgi:hypothetical protein
MPFARVGSTVYESSASGAALAEGASLGSPFQTFVNGTNLAAGTTGVIATAPTSPPMTWELLVVEVTLVLANLGSPRMAILQIDDGSSIKYNLPGAANAQAINTTCRYRWAVGANYMGPVGTSPNLEATGYLPPRFLTMPAYNVRLALPGIQAGDDFGAPILSVYEYRGSFS